MNRNHSKQDEERIVDGKDGRREEGVELDPPEATEDQGHTRAGSNVPNAGKDPSQGRHE